MHVWLVKNMISASEIIQKLRDREKIGTPPISRDEMAFLMNGLCAGQISEAQMAAFVMAVQLKGLSPEEVAALTLAMADSGESLDWMHLRIERGTPVVDKYSSGGVGDAVSLLLAPLLAACHCLVPMIAGHRLGHTGGTLDKMATIPGYSLTPDLSQLRETIKIAGCAIIGQSNQLAPATKKLSALREKAGTMEADGLILASVLSKKLVAGLDALCFDIKCGNGALSASPDSARHLARDLIETARRVGLDSRALVTDMNQPLAPVVGNGLEMAYVLEVLSGRLSPDKADRLLEVTFELGACLLETVGLAHSLRAGRRLLQNALESGKAAEHFAKMVAALGGPADLLEKPSKYLHPAPVIEDVPALQTGYVKTIDTRAIGMAVIGLESASPRGSMGSRVGFDQFLAIGSPVEAGRPLARVHATSPEAAKEAAKALQSCYQIADEKPCFSPVVIEQMGPDL